MSKPDSIEQYLKEARSWESSKVEELTNSRKTAWRVAGVSSACALLACAAVASLAPLKTTEPYVIRVDNSTGIVDVLKPLEDGKTNYDEATNKYFVQWYVRYREGYSRELAESYYSYVGLLSNGQEQQRYYQGFAPQNPLSPLNVYGDTARVKVQIKSTSFIAPNIALVRYTKSIERGGDRPQVTHWAATITFKYSKAPMKESDRSINPFGFQVTEYRNDPDAQVTDATPAPAIPQAQPSQAAPLAVSPTVVPGIKQ